MLSPSPAVYVLSRSLQPEGDTGPWAQACGHPPLWLAALRGPVWLLTSLYLAASWALTTRSLYPADRVLAVTRPGAQFLPTALGLSCPSCDLLCSAASFPHVPPRVSPLRAWLFQHNILPEQKSFLTCKSSWATVPLTHIGRDKGRWRLFSLQYYHSSLRASPALLYYFSDLPGSWAPASSADWVTTVGLGPPPPPDRPHPIPVPLLSEPPYRHEPHFLLQSRAGLSCVLWSGCTGPLCSPCF